jgi:hypothetical protein
MSERAFWKRIKRCTQDINIIWQRIESGAVGTGTPDLAYTVDGAMGWVELKHKAAWPMRETTEVKLRFPPEQRNFIWKHGKLGGRAWLLLQVSDDILLFNWKEAHNIGSYTRHKMMTVATKTWKAKKFTGESLLEELKKCVKRN